MLSQPSLRSVPVFALLAFAAGCQDAERSVAPPRSPPRFSVTSGEGTWTTKAPMPTARYHLATGVANGILYAVGGLSSSGAILATVEAYNPATNTWTSKASLPTARFDLAVGVVNGVLYAVGGVGPAGSVATVEAYNPATNTWTSKASLPTARDGLAIGVVNGILYAVGGQNTSGFAVATVEAYDPATNTWMTRAPMPTGRWLLAAGVVNGTLYAFGGSDHSSVLATVEAYDRATNTWTTKAPMPAPRCCLAAGAVNGILYAVGGQNTSGLAVSTVEAYDPATNTWTTKASMPTARWSLGADVVNGALYAAGGYNGAFLATVEAFQPSSGGVVFESNWSTALGTTARAIQDSSAPYGPWNLWADGGQNILAVVGGGPTGYANALRVQQRGESSLSWAQVQRNDFLPQSTDYYVRYYMRNDDTSAAEDHVVTVDYLKHSSLNYMRKGSGPNEWYFMINTTAYDDGTSGCFADNYPFNQSGPWQATTGVSTPPRLLRGEWYRFEYYVHFVDATHIQVHPRVYNTSGVLLFDDRHFRQQDYNPASGDTLTLARYYEAGNSFCVNATAMNEFGMGNNGQKSAINTGLYWYYAGVQIRTDGWPGQ
jgi:N-acetylneuraminic acid mutarotase